MLSRSFIASALLFSSSYVVAAPALVDLDARASTTFSTLTTAQITAYKPFTYFASTAYCKPATTLAWNCGGMSNCNGNSDFVPIASGGDGSSIQYWYVGWSPSQASVIVAHQGTDTSSITADATDLTATLTNLDSTLFPGVSTTVKAHSGFVSAQSKTATTILAQVKAVIAARSATKVTIVGHSLGAAIALLDGAYLPLHISGVTFKVVGYGMPRVGNQAFADYIDANVPVTHINNKKDPVPIVPGRSLGYHHPSGEVHIAANSSWISCPGQDNTSTDCSTGYVTSILTGSTSDHAGPYDGVTIGC